MRAGEKKKSRSNAIISRGVIILVLLMLAAQFGYFIYYIVQDLREEPHETVVSTARKDSTAAPSQTPDTQMRKRHHTEKGAPEKTHKQNPPQMAGKHVAEPTSGNGYTYDGWKWDMVELNSADSAALDGLPGIGPYYAKQILRYREQLWGRFHDIHQLMEIRGIDTTLFSKIKERIYIAPESIMLTDLYSISVDSLTSHPYIGTYLSKGINQYRSITPKEHFSINALVENRIITTEQSRRISLYFK